MNANQILRIAAAAMLCVSCGGSGGYGSSTPSTPTAPTTPSTSNVVTITIMGIKGSLSFSPNPAMCPAGQTVVWKNADTVAHRIVIDDLGVNTDTIAPGATSQPMPLGDVSKSYHCSIHPEMVGALNNASTPVPPGEPCGPYGC
jgi:plastocyanin